MAFSVRHDATVGGGVRLSSVTRTRDEYGRRSHSAAPGHVGLTDQDFAKGSLVELATEECRFGTQAVLSTASQSSPRSPGSKC